MKKSLAFCSVILMFLFVNICIAQTTAAIQVKASVETGKVMLRWGVDRPYEWQQANAKGFVISRMVIKRDGKLLNQPEKFEIARVKADELEKWMDFIQKNQYGAIIAQSMYGDSFEVDQTSESTVGSIVNKADELTQRHSFALYAADMSFEAAIKAGWGYVDSTIKSNEVYAYQISVADPLLSIKANSVMVVAKEKEQLPVVSDFNGIPGDKQVILSWGIEFLKHVYTSYKVERSTDKVTFTSLSDSPIVDINSNEKHNSNYVFFGDKFETNDTTYYYRMYGIDMFGVKGPYSAIIPIKGVASVLTAPRISDYYFTDHESVVLQWQFPKEEEKSMEYFQIEHSSVGDKEYKVIADKVDKTKREYEYKDLSLSNYLKVVSVDKQGRKLRSQSVLVQAIDSIPPVKPTGLEGQIDSLGIVRLKWKPNMEKDLAGYRLLRANTEKEEFVDVFNDIFKDNSAVDTLSFSIANKKVYYRILAEDFRYNRSDFSDVLVLEKPIKEAPTAPVFRDYLSKDGKIALYWINSSSDDAVQHVLKRRKKSEQQWLIIGSFTNKETEFIDTTVEANVLYEYLIQAQGLTGLWSTPEYSRLTIEAIDFKLLPVIKDIEYSADRSNRTLSIFWTYHNKQQPVEIQIYKNEKGMQPSLWKVLDAKYQSIIDKELKMNTAYEYYFVPEVNGQVPTKGEKIEVNF